MVSLSLVPSPETRKLLNAQRLAMMRPDSILVNTARSALIDMDALPAALDAGRPGIAALDVFDEEPLAEDHPLVKRANVVLSPHLGFVERAGVRRSRPTDSWTISRHGSTEARFHGRTRNKGSATSLPQ